MPKKTFLILRPKGKSNETQIELEKNGFNVVNEPICIIKKNLEIAINNNVKAIIITSGNACEAVLHSKINKEVKIFAIGLESAKPLIANGYNNIFYPKKPSAKDLYEVILDNFLPEEGEMVYFCSNEITFDFAWHLQSKHYKVKKIIAYEVLWNKDFSADFLQKIQATKIDFILFYSKNSVKNFDYLIKKHNIVEYFVNSRLLCLSNEIAKTAFAMGFKNINTIQINDFINYDKK